jgi:hypothetical protein
MHRVDVHRSTIVIGSTLDVRREQYEARGLAAYAQPGWRHSHRNSVC